MTFLLATTAPRITVVVSGKSNCGPRPRNKRAASEAPALIPVEIRMDLRAELAAIFPPKAAMAALIPAKILKKIGVALPFLSCLTLSC